MDEHSEDVFNIFNDMAKATGGLTESSSNPEYLFKKASDATENYYLLYYSPKDYKEDGEFKNIKVKVKGDGYKVTHRIGFFPGEKISLKCLSSSRRSYLPGKDETPT